MLLEYITLASGFNFTFLAAVLYSRNIQNLKSTQLLIRLLLCMAFYSSIVFFHYMAVNKGMIGILSYYLPIDGILLSTLAPCLYLYVMATLDVSVVRNCWTVFLHSLAFLPFVAFNLYFITMSPDDRMEWLIQDFHSGTIENNILNAVLYIQISVYLIISYLRVSCKINQSYQIVTYKIIPNLSWLKNYLLINLIYTLLSIPVCFYFANEQANIIIGQLAMNIQFVYLFFKVTSNRDSSIALYSIDKEKNTKVLTLKSDIAENMLLRLLSYMKDFKPFLNEACSIQSISAQTGIPVYQLSNIINNKLKKSFPEFINEYRINNAKHILLSEKTETITIESIATECGFGSKSTFNRTFKKYSNNLTPSEYILQYKANK